MKKRITTVTYVTTLSLFLIVTLFIWMEYAQDSMFIMIAAIILAALLHFILMIISILLVDKLRSRGFTREYYEIVQEYQEKSNAQVFLKELLNIKHPPKTGGTKDVYHFSMSTALHKNNRLKEALVYLDKIKPTTNQMKKAVEEQRRAIEKEASRSDVYS